MKYNIWKQSEGYVYSDEKGDILTDQTTLEDIAKEIFTEVQFTTPDFEFVPPERLNIEPEEEDDLQNKFMSLFSKQINQYRRDTHKSLYYHIEKDR